MHDSNKCKQFKNCFYYKHYHRENNNEYKSNDCIKFDGCHYYNDFQSKMEKIYSWQIVCNNLILEEMK